MRNFKNNRRRYRNNSFERNLKINSGDQGFNANLGNVSDFKKKIIIETMEIPLS